MDVEIRQVKKEELDEYFEVFSKGVEDLFPEFRAETKKYLYTNERTLNRNRLLEKIEEEHVVLAAFSDGKIIGILISDRPFGGISFAHWLIV